MEDFCNRLHKSIMKEFKQYDLMNKCLSILQIVTVCCGTYYLVCLYVCVCFCLRSAVVWGSSVKHNPQTVGKEHILNDEDVVQIVKR